ncbi:MAG: magnesium/cobalt transporter CorA [Candidatus Woesearchaeota archaeon]
MVSGYIKKKRFEQLKKPLANHNTNNLIWLDYINPTKEELKELSEKLKIDYSDLILALDESERPRIDSWKGYSYIIFNAPLYKRHVYTGTIGIYIKKNYVITIHKNALKSLSDIKAMAVSNTIRSKAPPGFVHLILSKIVKNFDASLDKMEDFIDIVETDVLKKIEKDYTEIVFPLKRTLIYFRKALKYNTEVLKLLRQGEIFKKKDLELYEDLYEDARQLIDEEAISRERLTEIVNTHLNTMSTDLNRVMKSFTVIATLILLPTLITGLYGMNFEFMPELHWKYGYLFALGIMVFSITAMLLFFKKKKWL